MRVFIYLLLLFLASKTLAAVTNVNEVSELFKKEVEDKAELEKFLEDSKGSAASGISNKEGLKMLPVSEEDAQKAVSDLNSIRVNSLESAGRELQAKRENEYLETLEIDYTSPLVINHKKDIDLIASASERLISRLIEGLRDLGVDCKTAKGNKEVEPRYRLDIQKEHFKDTVYNQKICEELRNRYNCRDNLKLTCQRKEMKWEEWQDKEIALSGWDLYWNHNHWGYEVYWKRKRHGWHIGGTYPHEVRASIARLTGVEPEQIHPSIGFPPSGRGIGNINPVGERWRIVWDRYVFRYKYRDGNLVCAQWKEDWTEECTLQ